MRRALTAFDITCIGVNAIVGSGIYLFPGTLSAALGAGSIGAWLVTGALCLPVMLTFAALGATEERTGGPIRYAELAFGRGVSFVVGWSAWVTSVLSWAAVARGISHYLDVFLPGVESPPASNAVTATVIVALAALNVVGVKPGARLTAALTIGKLVPLALFVIVGLFAVKSARFQAVPESALAAFPSLALMTMFAYQGFEVVGVAAGEVKEPRRVVPKAVVASLLLATVLYVLVQVVFVGVGGSSTDAALPNAARTFLGDSGAALLGVGGLISMLGFNAGTALSTPRYLQALAEERLVPSVLARQHARFLTPAPAIVTTSLLTLALTFVLGFKDLVDLAVLSVLCQYLATSAALVRLASTPGKKALGVLSLVVSVLFAVGDLANETAREAKLEQLTTLAGVLVLGIVIALATRALEKPA